MPGSRPQSPVDIFLKVAFLVVLVAITYLSLKPGTNPPDPGISDKIQHALAYAAAGLIGLSAFSRRRWTIAALLLSWGILMEIGQSYVPMRSSEAADVLANLTGISLAMGTIHLSRRLRPTGSLP
jgi:VanZ family protein